MKKLRIAKKFGTWYYVKNEADCYGDVIDTHYTLYNEQGKFVGTFAYYEDMRYYIQTGIMI